MEKVMEYILAIAQQQSISRAAETLFISQPALSAIIHKEEERLGLELFNRKVKPLQLTAAGEKYVAAAKRIKAIEDRLFRELNYQQSGIKRQLTICSYAFLFTHLLSSLVDEYKQGLAQPLEINLMEKRTEEALMLLQKKVADFVITTHQRRVKGCSFQPLTKEKIILAVPAAFAINQQLEDYSLTYQQIIHGAANNPAFQAISLGFFVDYPFILHVKTKEMYRRARQLFRNAGIKPKIASYMEDFLLMYFVARAGQGIIFIREAMLQYLEPSDKLVYYKIDDPLMTYNVNVYYKKEDLAHKEISDFLDYCNTYWQQQGMKL